MRREQRLTGRKQFARVYDEGGAWATRYLVLRALPNQLPLSRYGFVVGRRVGGAVVRNRVRRWLREAARATPTRQGWDMVFIGRVTAVDAGYWRLRAAMHELLARAELLADMGEDGVGRTTEEES